MGEGAAIEPASPAALRRCAIVVGALLAIGAVAVARRLRRLPLQPQRLADRLRRPLPEPRPGPDRPRRQHVQVRRDPRSRRTPKTPTRSSSAASAAPTSSTPTPLADTAFQMTTGRPDVTIAILDSGIKWNDAGRHDRPAREDPDQHRRGAEARERRPRRRRTRPGEDCSGAGPYDNAGDWDLNGDGVFNLDRLLLRRPRPGRQPERRRPGRACSSRRTC